MTITDEQRGDMLHALGLPEYPVNVPLPKTRRHHRIYRNYYTASVGGSSDLSWLDLVAKGLAVWRACSTAKDLNVYFVTLAGVEFLGAKHLVDESVVSFDWDRVRSKASGSG